MGSSSPAGDGQVLQVGVLLVQTRRIAQHGEQACLGTLTEALDTIGARVAYHDQVGADAEAIAEQIALLADQWRLPVVLTVGGTGLHPDDVAPDGAQLVIHRPAPGIAEAMRARVIPSNPEFMLTRGVAGVRGRTLVVNLPDSPPDLADCLEVLAPVLWAAVGRLHRTGMGAQTRIL